MNVRFDPKWKLEDIDVVKKLEEAILVQTELVEHLKRTVLRIASKYEMTERENVIQEGRY